MEEKEEAEDMRHGRQRGRRKVALMHWGWGCCVCWSSRCFPGWWGWCHLSSLSAPPLAPPSPWEDNPPQRLQRSWGRSDPSGALSRQGPSLDLSGRRSSIAGKKKKEGNQIHICMSMEENQPLAEGGRACKKEANLHPVAQLHFAPRHHYPIHSI